MSLDYSHSYVTIRSFNRIMAGVICITALLTFKPHYNAIAQSGNTQSHSQSHSHPHPHSHSHPHTHSPDHHPGDDHELLSETHPHTHLKVDYSFRPDAGNYEPPRADDEGFYWWKGNLHTHTLWSDGDQFPEVVTQWYYEHGYHFLALSDHNILSRGDRWLNTDESSHFRRGGGMMVYDVYSERFEESWIETRQNDDGVLEIRLKPLNEVKALFEESGRFIMIESEEITEREHVVHVNATNILELIEPETGGSVEETIRLNIDAVVEQNRRTGQEMIPHLNHPNFRSAVTAEDMAPVENMRLFEVYNGHRGVANFGADDGVKHLDRVWDIVLTKRLGEFGLDLLYGVATDDAHNYETSTAVTAEPGRGWVRVRSRFLTPEHIVRALRNGEFYSSSGVRIASFHFDGNRYHVQVDPEDGVDYTIRFIGTRRGYDTASEPYVDAEGQTRSDRTRRYSDNIGTILKEVQGNEAEYTFNGDELYVRAKVISSKLKENYFAEGEFEKAWLQPVRPGQSK